jgi:hypothetical protein
VSDLPVKVSYTNAQRELAVAAYRRYGATSARKQLAEVWDEVPGAGTMRSWSLSEQHEPSDVATDFWAKVDSYRRTQMQQQLSERFESSLEAYDHFVEERDALSMRGAAIAVGIIYDKLVPPNRGGGSGLTVQAGEGGTVNMMVVAAPSDGSQRRALDVPHDAAPEGEVVDP